MKTILIPMVLVLAACAGNRFGKLYPGMTQDQVVKTMDGGPSEAQPYKDGYAAWYYGEDQCILFQNEKIVSKAESKDKGGLSILGVGAKQIQPAECVPPGEARTRKVERSVETPWGSANQ